MKVKVYCCSKDALYHIPDDCHGIRIFFSKKSAIEQISCLEENKGCCKLVEMELEVPEDIEDGI
jgi:hypothetical protein